MHTGAPGLIRTADELDGEWLAAVLASGPVAAFSLEQIGTGQMSESHRLSISYEDPRRAGPATAVLKLASSDSTSRATGVGLGIYAREVRFYTELAPRIGGPLASCSFAQYDPGEGWFTLLLEDVRDAAPGDQIAGCSLEQASLAMSELARLHAPVFADQALAEREWLNQPSPLSQALVAQLLPGFFERYGERVSEEHRALCERLVGSLDHWLADRHPPLGLVHGDFRLDNLLFGSATSPRPLTVVDWQTVGYGAAMADAAYFLGGGLRAQDRRSCEAALLEQYHEALSERGVRAEREACQEQFRRQTLGGVLMAIVASMLVERTERGDEMFMAMLARHCDHALDLGADEFLQAPASAPRPLSHPQPGDERPHDPGSEQLWNESWYFDAVSADGALGAYVRVGAYPNLGVCWYTACICGPERPTVAVIDWAAQLPEGEDLRVQAPGLRAKHRCLAPLERFSVQLEAEGELHEDPAELLRGERGERIPVALELEWHTDGIPYAYSLATRYEIPCRVSGTLRLGEELLTLERAVGQRDHSWGPRDWWSMDWLWSAVALDDGTRLHAVELRMPNAPRLGVGYVQPAGTTAHELERVSASERVGADGLVTAGALSLAPPQLELEIDPLAYGPLRLISPGGRVSHFTRAMCRLRCADGRGGLGWVEWNLNQTAAGDGGG